MRRCIVIFLHGLACTSAAFDPLFADPNLTSGLFMVSRTSFLIYRLNDDPFGVQIRYDTRGHGRTGGPDNPEGYVSKRMPPHRNCRREA
jgi:pimeloyl-ACP methyl ester carboxylesterase